VGGSHHAKTNVCVLLIVIRKGEIDMTIKDNIETVEYIDDIYPSHFDEHDIVRCEIQEAIQSGDWDRARQLASLIDITIQ
tara:strand:+ start:1044 stop:1283 length:240 start_codon:yes stop_codon:yes gene_type:complete